MSLTYSLKKVRDLEPGNHLCCVYETGEEHRAIITPFLLSGLEQDEKVLYITYTQTREDILDYLQDDGLQVDAYLGSGQLCFQTHDETYLLNGIFDPDKMLNLLRTELKRALSEGYSAMRVTGDMAWAILGLPGSDRLIEYEAKLNEFFPGSRCLGLCQYDRSRFVRQIASSV